MGSASPWFGWVGSARLGSARLEQEEPKKSSQLAVTAGEEEEEEEKSQVELTGRVEGERGGAREASLSSSSSSVEGAR